MQPQPAIAAYPTPCEVPGCPTHGTPAKYICQSHLRMVDADLRALLREAERRAANNPTLFRYRVVFKLWAKVRKQAIERSVGI
jgi:hypothetical protein